jgi:hypothetical protein
MNFLTILPGELRNLIYSYALSYDTPLTIRPDSPVAIRPEGPNFHTYLHDPVTNTQKRVVENLPLVCKQLHHETLGLIYRYNDIAFTSAKAMRMCSRFLRGAPENVQKRLRKVIVFEKRPKDPTRMYKRVGALLTGQIHRGVYDFCNEHPRVGVVVRMGGEGDPGWVVSAMVGSVDDVPALTEGILPLRVVSLWLALRNGYTGDCEFPEKAQKVAEGDFMQAFREFVEELLWQDADRSKVLGNYRATPIASFEGEMGDEMFVLAKEMFERGC